METNSRLTAFIAKERHEYGDEGVNLFAFALGQAARYDQFLQIILHRHAANAAEWQRATKAWMTRISEVKDRPLNEEEMAEWRRQSDLVMELHLEIESFYLFSKIFLDQIARFLEGHFGAQRSLSLDSHDALAKSFERYSQIKSLNCPDNVQATLNLLKTRIADYRDYQIAHAKNPRTLHATSWGGPDGGVSIQRTPLYPKPNETATNQSESLFELRKLLDTYIEQIIALIAANREKSRYLKSKRPVSRRHLPQ